MITKWDRAHKVPRSAVIWRGASSFDGSPIVAIVTGMHRDNKNMKIGPGLAQLWIIRSDVSPLEAIAFGLDGAICGGCKHRGNGAKKTRKRKARKAIFGKDRTCYVNVSKCVRSIYACFARGGYVDMTPDDVLTHLASRGMGIRIGAYGDGAALPIALLHKLTSVYHTGYTHSWQTRDDLKPYLMASVDTPEEYAVAAAADWRTFRVRTANQELAPREIACPASDESGNRTTCDSCKLCDGARTDDRRKSVAIIVHGIGVKTFIRLQTVA